MDDTYYMKMALKEAQVAYEEGEIPVGVIIVSNDHIISRAHNQTETLGDITAHAEILAITSAEIALGSKYLTNCTIYVTLEPCIMCAGALAWSQISRLVYGASDSKKGYTVFTPNALHPKTQVTKGLLEEECSEIIRKFFKEKR